MTFFNPVTCVIVEACCILGISAWGVDQLKLDEYKLPPDTAIVSVAEIKKALSELPYQDVIASSPYTSILTAQAEPSMNLLNSIAPVLGVDDLVNGVMANVYARIKLQEQIYKEYGAQQ